MAKLKFTINLKSTNDNKLDKLKIKLMSSGDFTIVNKGTLNLDSGIDADLIVLDVSTINREVLKYIDEVHTAKEIDNTLGTEAFSPEVCILDNEGILRSEIARSPQYSIANCTLCDSVEEVIDFIRKRFIERMF